MKAEALDVSPEVYSVGSSSLLSRPKKLFTITHNTPITGVSLSPDSIAVWADLFPYSVKYRSTGKLDISVLRHISYRRSRDPFPLHGFRILLPPYSARDYFVLNSTVGLNFPILSMSFSVALTTVRPAGTFDIGAQWHRDVPLLSAKFSNESITALMTARPGAFGLGVVIHPPVSVYGLSANLWRVSGRFDVFFQAFRTWHCTDQLRIAAALDWHPFARRCSRAAITYRGIEVGLQVAARHFQATVPTIGIAWAGSAGQGIGATLVLAPPLRFAGRVRPWKTGIGDVDVGVAVKVNPLKSGAPQWSFGIDWSSASDAQQSDVGAAGIVGGWLERIKDRWLSVAGQKKR
jgi:hypothetical protein